MRIPLSLLGLYEDEKLEMTASLFANRHITFESLVKQMQCFNLFRGALVVLLVLVFRVNFCAAIQSSIVLDAIQTPDRQGGGRSHRAIDFALRNATVRLVDAFVSRPGNHADKGVCFVCGQLNSGDELVAEIDFDETEGGQSASAQLGGSVSGTNLVSYLCNHAAPKQITRT